MITTLVFDAMVRHEVKKCGSPHFSCVAFRKPNIGGGASEVMIGCIEEGTALFSQSVCFSSYQMLTLHITISIRDLDVVAA